MLSITIRMTYGQQEATPDRFFFSIGMGYPNLVNGSLGYSFHSKNLELSPEAFLGFKLYRKDFLQTFGGNWLLASQKKAKWISYGLQFEYENGTVRCNGEFKQWKHFVFSPLTKATFRVAKSIDIYLKLNLPGLSLDIGERKIIPEAMGVSGGIKFSF